MLIAEVVSAHFPLSCRLLHPVRLNKASRSGAGESNISPHFAHSMMAAASSTGAGPRIYYPGFMERSRPFFVTDIYNNGTASKFVAFFVFCAGIARQHRQASSAILRTVRTSGKGLSNIIYMSLTGELAIPECQDFAQASADWQGLKCECI